MCRLRGSIRADLVRFAAFAIAYVSAHGLPCRCGSTRTARLRSRARPFDLGAPPAFASYPRNPAGSFFSSVMALNRSYHSVTHLRLCLPIRCVTHLSAVLMCRLRGSIRADLVRSAAASGQTSCVPRQHQGRPRAFRGSIRADLKRFAAASGQTSCVPRQHQGRPRAFRGNIRADFVRSTAASGQTPCASASGCAVLAEDHLFEENQFRFGVEAVFGTVDEAEGIAGGGGHHQVDHNGEHF